ncbi:MAG: GFA family protein [Actinomycetota bacterium]|nr:GFA family protein [Actinomycetota bacterium]
MKGSCLCGAVAYKVDRLDTPILHCHCATYRKAHAVPIAPTAGVCRRRFRWLEGEEKLSFYETLPGKRRYFCSVCGSHLVSSRASQDYVVLSVTTLKQSPHAVAQAYIWTSHGVPWLEYGESGPSYPSLPPPDGQLRR